MTEETFSWSPMAFERERKFVYPKNDGAGGSYLVKRSTHENDDDDDDDNDVAPAA